MNVTSACNLDCPQCHFKNYKSSVSYLSSDDIIKAVDAIISLQGSGSEYLMLSLYGGEPFLNKKNIKKALETMGNCYQDKKIYWIINTNATLIKNNYFFL
ncbi:MAG: radical SAM protein [Nanobdellota archaeon]